MMLKPIETTVEDLAKPQPFLVLSEGLVVTFLLPVLGFWRNPHDPFFLQSSFPWLLLAPLTLSLRYGFAQGLGSATVLCLMMYGFLRAGLLGSEHYPGSISLGLLLVAMLAGEFCDMWHRRLHRLSALNFYQRTLVEKFTRSYHMLSLSHAQLERRVQANTRSLRETMTYLRTRALLIHSDAPDHRELYHLIMEVLSSFGSLQVAAFYRVDEYDIFIPEIVAKLGNPKPVPISDPMLLHALTSKQLTCIRPEEAPAPAADNKSGPIQTAHALLAVLPFVDVQGRLWGVVTVQAMPFEALSVEHLHLLAVLGGQMGDLLALGSGGGLHQFHVSLLRSHSDARAHNLAAMLVGFVVDPARAPPTLWSTLLDQHRDLDQQWLLLNCHGHRVLLMVMPLTDAEGARGFLQRLDQWCKTQHGTSLIDAGVRVHQVALDGVGLAQSKLRALRRTCEINGD